MEYSLRPTNLSDAVEVDARLCAAPTLEQKLRLRLGAPEDDGQLVLHVRADRVERARVFDRVTDLFSFAGILTKIIKMCSKMLKIY